MGAVVIPQNKPAESLYLNPGPAMADPWLMNDKKKAHGMGMIATYKKGEMSYKVVKMPAPAGG